MRARYFPTFGDGVFNGVRKSGYGGDMPCLLLLCRKCFCLVKHSSKEVTVRARRIDIAEFMEV